MYYVFKTKIKVNFKKLDFKIKYKHIFTLLLGFHFYGERVTHFYEKGLLFKYSNCTVEIQGLLH